jgi:hypothetical protein
LKLNQNHGTGKADSTDPTLSASEGHTNGASFEKHDGAIMGTFCVAISHTTLQACAKEVIRVFTTKFIDIAVFNKTANCGVLEREKGTSTQ